MRYPSILGICVSVFLSIISGMRPTLAAPPVTRLPEPVAPSSAPTSEAKPSAETSYHIGLQYLRQGDLDNAEAAFKASLTFNDSYLPALLGLADVALKQKQPDDAATYLQRLLDLAPESAAAHTAWGRYLATQQRYQEAETAFRKAMAFEPQNILPRMALGALYIQALRQPEKAIAAYREAIAIAPDNASAHYALGIALATTGDLDGAQTAFTESARLSPQNPLSFQALGQLHLRRQDHDKALQAFAQALTARPNFSQAHLARGDIFMSRRQDEQALTEYKAALQMTPKLAQAHVKIGMIHERRNRVADAEEAYKAALAIDPNLPLAYNNLAWHAAERQKQLDQALIWAQKAVELAPNVPQFQDTLGWVHRARGEYEEAAAILKHALEAEPNQAEILYHLGVVYAEQGQTDEAVAALQSALKLAPNFAAADDARQRLDRLQKP